MYMPWLSISRGSDQLGIRYAFRGVRIRKRSSTTGVSSGAPLSFQSGISSFRARGSMIAPERMCAPTSEPFSSRQTETSLPVSAGQLLQADRRGETRRAAADDHDVVVHHFALHVSDPVSGRRRPGAGPAWQIV